MPILILQGHQNQPWKMGEERITDVKYLQLLELKSNKIESLNLDWSVL